MKGSRDAPLGAPEPRSAAAVASGEAPARWVLLGASNLVKGLPLALAAIADPISPEAAAGERKAVFAAPGHGRSYGLASRVLFRELPSIRDCGIWSALEVDAEDRGGPTRALVTDVGNDLGYGVDPETILAWVEDVLGRLARLGAQITLVGLPLEAFDSRSDLELAVARRIFFPTSDLTVARARDGVERLAAGLAELASARSARFVPPPPDWYGLDPIHPRRSRRVEMWSVLLGRGTGDGAGTRAPTPPRFLHRVRCRLWAPEERRILGLPAGGPQPAGSFRGWRVFLH